MLFPDILGHNRVLRLLEQALKSERLAHAYLFSGLDGVGKAIVALKITASLLCTANSELPPCGECSDCIQFSSGNHPDFIHIVPDGASIRIDQIRDLQKQLIFSPFAGGLRVIIIEEAQTMSKEAGNSLLKLLEEPPPNNIFFLIAADGEPILATIISRCQVIAFSPISIDITGQIIRAQRPELNEQQLIMLARMSGGSPGRALTIKFDVVLPLWEDIIAGLLTQWPSRAKTVEELLLLAREMAALKNDLELLFDLLRLFFKEALQFSLQSDGAGLNGSLDINMLKQARERWSLSHLSDKLDNIDAAAEALAGNCTQELICKVLLFRLITPYLIPYS